MTHHDDGCPVCGTEHWQTDPHPVAVLGGAGLGLHCANGHPVLVMLAVHPTGALVQYTVTPPDGWQAGPVAWHRLATDATDPEGAA